MPFLACKLSGTIAQSATRLAGALVWRDIGEGAKAGNIRDVIEVAECEAGLWEIFDLTNGLEIMEQIRSQRVLTPSLISEMNPHTPVSKANGVLREQQQRDDAMASARGVGCRG